MRKKAHIGISLAEKLKELFAGDKTDKPNGLVEKHYEGTDDNFFEATNAILRTVLDLDAKSESYERDLKRFGTREKLIEVADDKIPNKRRSEILPLKKPYKRKCFDSDDEKDLQRFGTRPGIINVSDDHCKHKKKLRTFPTDFSKAAYNNIMQKWTVRDTNRFSANPFSDIYREFPKLQINIRNTSTEEQQVFVWGPHRNETASAPKPEDVQNHAIVETVSLPAGSQPQGMEINPYNQYLYIANQLSGTVTVLDNHNQLVKVIQLEPSFPGFASLVSVAVNTNPASSHYGYAYVACSVSNNIAVIDKDLNVAAMVPTGVRPVSIAFNPVNNFVYTANLVSDNVTVIDTETNEQITMSPLAAGNDPISIGVNPTNGEVYIANSLSNSITVYDYLNTLLSEIPNTGQYPASICYNPANNSMYAVATNSNTVLQINAATHTVVTSLITGSQPCHAFFNTDNNYLYVQNSGDNTVTIIRPDNSIIGGIAFGPQSIGGVFSTFSHSIYISDPINNSINVVGYANANTVLVFSPDYNEMLEDVKNNPCIVQHVKIVVTGEERLNSFRMNKFTPTGNLSSKPLSLELYASPQATLNVAEVTELAGTIIDRKMNWQFRLPGLHSVTILIWFRQFEVRDILTLPENSLIIKNK